MGRFRPQERKINRRQKTFDYKNGSPIAVVMYKIFRLPLFHPSERNFSRKIR
uniref:Ribosomal protein S18 n=1 Tax=Romanomermis culicivorax TaxID=13658 RepID=A0A915JKZ1_ROMCU